MLFKEEIGIRYDVPSIFQRININALKAKAQRLLAAYPGYKAKWMGLGIEDTKDYL